MNFNKTSIFVLLKFNLNLVKSNLIIQNSNQTNKNQDFHKRYYLIFKFKIYAYQ